MKNGVEATELIFLSPASTLDLWPSRSDVLPLSPPNPSGTLSQTGVSIFVFNPPLIPHLFCFNLSLAITPSGGVWQGVGGVVVYGPGGLWVLVGGGGGGATNLRPAPKAVSGAPGALRRQPARSPWIGGRRRRRHAHTCRCPDEIANREDLAFACTIPTSSHKQMHTCVHIDRQANTEVVTLYTLFLSHTHTHTHTHTHLSLSETQLIF